MTTEFNYPAMGRMLTTEEELREVFAHILAGNVDYSRIRRTIDMVEEGGRWLDLGCGPGGVSYSIADKVDEVVAIDPDAETIKIAKTIFQKPNIKFKKADFFDQEFQESTFDGVLFLEVIEHVLDPYRFLKEIHRVLRPGGYLILSTPNALSYRSIVRNFRYFTSAWMRRSLSKVWANNIDARTQEGHIFAWDFGTLARLLRASGFSQDAVMLAGFEPFKFYLGGRIITMYWKKEVIWAEKIYGSFCGNLLMRVRANK